MNYGSKSGSFFALTLAIGTALSIGLSSIAEARSMGIYSLAAREDNFAISNGQGISSPSFWNGIEGANPAGLIYNQTAKIQGSLATFDDSVHNVRGSGGLLAGNGVVAGGVEYSQYQGTPYLNGDYAINFGGALNLSSLNTTIGVSGSHYSWGADGTYNVGALINLTPSLRIGGELPDVSNGMHIVAAGITYTADPMVDFVVDAGYHLQDKNGIVKPGITLHTDIIQASAAYGFRYAGAVDDVLVTTKFTAGLALKFSQNIFVEYEYRELPEHRVGLTLRFN